MLPAALAVVVAFFLVGWSAPSGGGTAEQASLELARGMPFTLRGSQFASRERVRVTVTSHGRRATKLVVSSARGRFLATFAEVAYDRCSGLAARAVGSRGNRAALKLPQPLCPPSL